MSKPREVFLAPQFPAGACPPVSRVRSTLLSASLTSIRAMGWEQRYFDALPRELHDPIRLLTAGVWIPLEMATAHYGSCDRMGLSSEQVEQMGRTVSLRTQQTFVGTLGRMAAGAGVTPWTFYEHVHRIWSRIFEGGDHIVYKVGPKDLEVHCMGCALLGIRYFRTALGAYYGALTGLVAKSVHWREIPERRGRDAEVAFRLSWV
jgi:hypothetical protein